MERCQRVEAIRAREEEGGTGEKVENKTIKSYLQEDRSQSQLVLDQSRSAIKGRDSISQCCRSRRSVVSLGNT